MKKDTIKAGIYFGIAFLILITLIPLARAENLYASVIRIHVIANSDSKEDQEDKLAVRDRILEYVKENFSSTDSVSVAKKEMEASLGALEQVAREELSRRGKNESVRISLTKEVYPTRHYDSFSLPAGEYCSLQIKIGSATGKNWWCVLFPPMCLESSLAPEDALVEAGMERENARVVTRGTKKYRVRFKIIELWAQAKEKIEEIF